MQQSIVVGMLFISNIFMNFAWYGHLKHKEEPLYKVIFLSWGIAFFEYLITVPANRIGSSVFTLFQLKIMQEIITIIVFIGLAVLYFGEKFRWNYAVGMIFIILAVIFVFNDWK